MDINKRRDSVRHGDVVVANGDCWRVVEREQPTRDQFLGYGPLADPEASPREQKLVPIGYDEIDEYGPREKSTVIQAYLEIYGRDEREDGAVAAAERDATDHIQAEDHGVKILKTVTK